MMVLVTHFLKAKNGLIGFPLTRTGLLLQRSELTHDRKCIFVAFETG